MWVVTILSFLAVYHVNSFHIRIDPLVHIDQGLVKGEKSSDGGYSTFFGVPYARVDLDDPFGPAKPASDFDGIFNAIDSSVKCPQSSKDGHVEGDLDCLRLNIYVPDQASSTNPLPVLIWIHGGGFGHGSGAQFNPSNLVKRGIIVVTINYRLGPYGFLCLDLPSVPGNQGVKDQYQAIRWVRNNIAAFGGNPYEVTLGGESAGAPAVLYHLYSSKDKLYNKVIVQSDTPQTESMFVNKDVKAAVKIARHLGLNTTDSKQALEFLTNTSPDLVVAAYQKLNLQLKPCKEATFDEVDNIITSDPFSLSNQRKVSKTVVLIGHTSKEHIGILQEMYGDDYLQRNPFSEKIRDNFNLNDQELAKAAKIVEHFYVGEDPLTEKSLSVLEDFDSDFVFGHPVQRTVTKLLEENAKVYQYLFSYVGDSGEDGAGHETLNNYLFSEPNANYNAEDKVMIDGTVTLWANFVKYGNPTPSESNLLPVTWKPASITSRPYLNVETNLRMENRVFHDRMAFWDLFYSFYEKYNIFAEED